MAKKGTLLWWEEKVWKEMSRFVRMRDAWEYSKGDVVKCCTCSHVAHWKELQGGHFVSRRHKATKFNERNVHAQCGGCNAKHMGGGKEWEHGQYIDRRYGKGTAELLKHASTQMVKRTVFEMEQLYEYFREKVKEQENLRNGKRVKV